MPQDLVPKIADARAWAGTRIAKTDFAEIKFVLAEFDRPVHARGRNWELASSSANPAGNLHAGGRSQRQLATQVITDYCGYGARVKLRALTVGKIAVYARHGQSGSRSAYLSSRLFSSNLMMVASLGEMSVN